MRVLVSIQQRSFARYVAFDLAEAARRLGWQVLWIDFDGHAQRLSGQPPAAWQATLAALAAEIEAFKPDLVFSYGLEAFTRTFLAGLPGSTWVLADLAQAPVACFFYDFGAPFDRPPDTATVRQVARLQQADVRVFCWDRAALADLHRFGVAAEYLPMAVNEQMFYPPPEGSVRDVPVVFSGGATADRMAALRPLAPFGLAIYGYGDEWQADPVLAPCHHGLVHERHQMRAIYQRARIAVNITRAHGRASLNMRVFEAMACGSLVVTDQAAEATRLFPDGSELVAVGDGDDLAAVVGALLHDPPTGERIARRGAEAVRTAHTYVGRLTAIAPTLRRFVTESRAWPYWQRFLEADPLKALRFVSQLRREGPLLREDLWHVAQGTAYLRVGNRDAAAASLAAARRMNPALQQLSPLEQAIGRR